MEVFYNSIWGTVCDDLWSLRDATVVCHQLGYPGVALNAPGSSQFGSGNEQGLNYLLDNVMCNGNEANLNECAHDGLNVHNCAVNEDAGVVCSGMSQSLSLNMLIYVTPLT